MCDVNCLLDSTNNHRNRLLALEPGVHHNIAQNGDKRIVTIEMCYIYMAYLVGFQANQLSYSGPLT